MTSRRANRPALPDQARSWVTASLLTFAATLALTLVIYWSAIFGTYGRSDDYIYVHDVRTDTLDSGLGAVWFNAERFSPSCCAPSRSVVS